MRSLDNLVVRVTVMSGEPEPAIQLQMWKAGIVTPGQADKLAAVLTEQTGLPVTTIGPGSR